MRSIDEINGDNICEGEKNLFISLSSISEIRLLSDNGGSGQRRLCS